MSKKAGKGDKWRAYNVARYGANYDAIKWPSRSTSHKCDTSAADVSQMKQKADETDRKEAEE